MIVKKTGKIILGAELTSEEKKAMDVVLHKEFARINKKNAIEIDAIFLWELHQQLGFGPKRLKDFFMGFHPAYQSLIHKYEYDTEEDGIWLCTKKLKDIGVDIEAWNAEMDEVNVYETKEES